MREVLHERHERDELRREQQRAGDDERDRRVQSVVRAAADEEELGNRGTAREHGEREEIGTAGSAGGERGHGCGERGQDDTEQEDLGAPRKLSARAGLGRRGVECCAHPAATDSA